MAFFTYKPLTFQNGSYNYPVWAHILGISIVAITLLLIPAYSIFSLCRNDGDTLMQKWKSSIKPKHYECKICLEHHCNHDLNESIHEMASINNNFTPIVLQSPPSSKREKTLKFQQNVDKPSSSKDNVNKK